MAQTMLTSITKDATVYSMGRTANMVLSDLQARLIKLKITTDRLTQSKNTTKLFNEHTQRRGFSSLFGKACIY